MLAGSNHGQRQRQLAKPSSRAKLMPQPTFWLVYWTLAKIIKASIKLKIFRGKLVPAHLLVGVLDVVKIMKVIDQLEEIVHAL